MNNLLDRIYAEPHAEVSGFAFDDAVARVFPDMIRRSVPGYTTIIPMIGIIASQYAQPHTELYDLGCSLGASTLAMRHGVDQPGCRIVGVDNSDAMLERCRKYIDADSSSVPVDLLLDDIRSVPVANASVVTLNFTLQFIPLEDRLALLSQIADGLNPGGVLILSEKLVFEDGEQSVLEELHYDFKRANGYSDLEISQKRTALEDYLVPETLGQHRERLLAAGFSRVVLWYQCFNFCSLLAIK
ncbi:carboxy-S-adenosyl-L-methionine synthase CmoA [Kistimonas scapharcae]|uniref:Carboxy-S-adenosyl-L-methionine synthase n=1 Tax=Kistimonas scapharcae TaxID=1036133 RepID=A0ABP8VC28_9GAMM